MVHGQEDMEMETLQQKELINYELTTKGLKGWPK